MGYYSETRCICLFSREDICISRKYSNSVTNNWRLSLDSRLLRLVCLLLLLHFHLEGDEGVDGLAIYLLSFRAIFFFPFKTIFIASSHLKGLALNGAISSFLSFICAGLL